MSKAAPIFRVALLAAGPALAANKGTVEQLSHEVASVGEKSDVKIAERLYDLQLTRRLSAAKLASFEAAMPGPDSRRALAAQGGLSMLWQPRCLARREAI